MLDLCGFLLFLKKIVFPRKVDWIHVNFLKKWQEDSKKIGFSKKRTWILFPDSSISFFI